jgi:uncharacterized repeat protein (TIGR02543 family)
MKKLKSFSLIITFFLALSVMSCANGTTGGSSGPGNGPSEGGTTQTFTVTFNANGGNGAAPSPQTVNAGYSVAIPSGASLSKSGFTFGGWNTKADGTEINFPAGTSITPTGDITLYAKWDAAAVSNFTINFNANGGTGTVPSPQTVKAGSSVTIPSGDSLTKEGFIFGGWNTSATGTEINYNAGSSFTPAGNITLYAKWDTSDEPSVPVTHTVAFNTNGGSGTVPNALTVNDGSSVTLPNGNGLSKSGFTFGGWNTKADGTGTNLAGGASITPSGNITLYAKWDVVVLTAFTVTYSSNGGTGTVPNPVTVQEGNGIILPPQGDLSKTGFVFGGWNTKADGTGINFAAGTSITPLGNITLNARWDAETLDTITGLANKLAWLQTNAVSGGDYLLEVGANESINPQTLSYNGRNNITITLRGVDSNRTISLSSNGSMFTVGSGVTLVLDNNITLQGLNTNSDDSLVYVGSGGTLRMNDATISENGNVSVMGGGVYVKGAFTMSGGVIRNNNAQRGGGVYVEGTFTMSGGIIRNNNAHYGGGVYVTGSGTFSKTGGTITGYASDKSTGNRAASSPTTSLWSHAVYAGSDYRTAQYKETTAGPGDNLFWRNDTFSGAWDYDGGGINPTVTNVIISPTTAGVEKGKTQSFSATVTGTNNPSQNVTWLIVQANKHSGTNINASGLLTVSENEALTTLTVRATSTVDTGKYGEAAVTLTATAPTVTQVTVSPTTAGVEKGKTQSFSATVTGTNNPSQNVTWSIVQTNKHSGTSINASGLLTVSENEALTTLTVRATSTVDTSKYGEAAVTITPIPLESVTGLVNKLAWLQANAVSGGNYIIEVTADESIALHDLSYNGRSNITITLRGVGSNRTISPSSKGVGLGVGSGVTLVLDNNITLRGRSDNNVNLVFVSTGGTLQMNTGSTITGNTGSGVASYGTFNMKGGTISNNSASVGGGVQLLDGGSFNMSGGSISGNTATVGAGGVYMDNNTFFTMSGGTITANTASSNFGGGVVVAGTFNMSGGTISGNISTGGYETGGAGVYIQHGVFTKTGGIITGYASDTSNGNVVKDRSGAILNNMGHAVYAIGSGVTKRKETTAGTNVNLFINGITGVFSGAWDN